ncbi:MAG: hypothetical protein WD509_03000 [Candidatus Paceibacterota bacterium]
MQKFLRSLTVILTFFVGTVHLAHADTTVYVGHWEYHGNEFLIGNVTLKITQTEGEKMSGTLQFDGSRYFGDKETPLDTISFKGVSIDFSATGADKRLLKATGTLASGKINGIINYRGYDMTLFLKKE